MNFADFMIYLYIFVPIIIHVVFSCLLSAALAMSADKSETNRAFWWVFFLGVFGGVLYLLKRIAEKEPACNPMLFDWLEENKSGVA